MKEQPTRILYLIYDLAIGGAQNVIINSLRNIDSRKFTARVVACVNRNSPYDEEAKKYDVVYLKYKNHRLLRIFFNWIFLQVLIYKEIVRYKPDIVHSHITMILPYVVLPCMLAGVKLRLHTLHSDPYEMRFIYVIWARLAFKLFGVKPICLSETHNQRVKARYKASNTVIIPIGIDYSKFNISEDKEHIKRELGIEGKYVIGSLGRLDPAKNFEFLLELFAEYEAHHSNTVLLLVGDGPDRDNLEKLACRLGIEDKVFFAGQRSDTERMYRAMDVFVFPSFFEVGPLVVIEAQLIGLKCIMSDNIYSDVVFTPRVRRLSLSKSAAEWAEAIDSDTDYEPIACDYQKYSAEYAVEQMCKYYSELLREQGNDK